jgi:hypothetical protein
MQRIALSWSLARPRHTARKLAGLALLVFWLVNAAHADENLAGSGSVGEWRTKLGHSELATAAYAAGVMATGSIFSECKNTRTVRELHSYLLYRAPSTLTMAQAIASFLSEGECTVVSDDRPAPSDPSQWRTKARIYGEEP